MEEVRSPGGCGPGGFAARSASTETKKHVTNAGREITLNVFTFRKDGSYA